MENRNLEELDFEEEDAEEVTTGGSVAPAASSDDDASGWLTSYADLMTLVACFFILMMAFANYDPATFQRKAELMAQYFQGESSDNESPDEMIKLMNELNQISNQSLKIKHNEMGLDVTINVTTLFELGSANLTQEARVLVEKIIEKVQSVDSNVRIAVEGHTDNLPIIGSPVFPSNWELSAARASSVLRVFEKYDFDRSNMVAIGLADTRPAYPNSDKEGNPLPENQLKNRRITIKVLRPKGESVPMGLGVLFESP